MPPSRRIVNCDIECQQFVNLPSPERQLPGQIPHDGKPREWHSEKRSMARLSVGRKSRAVAILLLIRERVRWRETRLSRSRRRSRGLGRNLAQINRLQESGTRTYRCGAASVAAVPGPDAERFLEVAAIGMLLDDRHRAAAEIGLRLFAEVRLVP